MFNKLFTTDDFKEKLVTVIRFDTVLKKKMVTIIRFDTVFKVKLITITKFFNNLIIINRFSHYYFGQSGPVFHKVIT